MTLLALLKIIETIYPIILLIIGFITIWKMLTKRIKEDIDHKVDQKEFDNLKEDVHELEDVSRDTNRKVNNIWEYVVMGKLTMSKNDEKGN